MNKWKCDINPNRRRDCGYPGISKIRCSLRKCCFDPGKTGANRCYFSKVLAQSGFAETLEESAKEIKAGEQPLQAGPIEDVLQVAGKANLKCAISPFWRRECGYPGIKQRECSNRKCCFDAGKTGSKRCYFSREHAQPGLTGTLDESAKEIEGGKESPQAPPIEDVGQVSGCSISHKLRKDCGYPNISSEDCHSKGCCYDPSVAGTVRCFYKDK
ncbi:hypothetical protein AB205_0207060 [Aquarana catesbeiana]|uniref:P-type domain-containing protein n=2 Tax=Aquarana catesbeiana TaxID=8400 RepID=A0A2G9QLE4_AQUCT|nr:hypothetical protein AB205_0207060 [Aquarana catesbeiana]